MAYAMTNISLNRTLVNTTQSSLVPKYPYAVVFSLIQLFGISGNIMVIYSIAKHRDLLKRTYYCLVLHLAICDLTCLVVFGMETWFAWSPNSSASFWKFSNVMCYIWSLLKMVCQLGGWSFMIVIAIFRYRAVVYPLKPAVSRSKLRVIVGAVYICVTICAVPGSFVFTVEECISEWPISVPYVLHIISYSIQWLIPVAVLSILYYKICRALKKQSKNMDSINASCASSGDTTASQTHLQRTNHRRNTRIVITSTTIVVCFAVTTLPLTLAVIFLVSDAKVNYQFLRWSVLVQIFGVCAVNPYIYGVSDNTLCLAYKQNWNKVKALFTRCSREASPAIV